MILPSFRRLAALGGLLFFVTAALAAEPAIIAKARARLASDATLDAVRSIHYVGTLISPTPGKPDEETRSKIEIILQKPSQQRIVITMPDVIEVSALDGYEAWKRTTAANDPTNWQQQQLGVEQIRQLRADVWQNLYFFRGIEKIGGSVEDQGSVTMNGVVCRKVAFSHTPTLIYYRYFNADTGELVFTGDEQNNVREEGEIVAGGIRFPKTIFITQVLASGEKVERRIDFETITVNESFPASLFAVPLPTLK
ncbi:MAG TPA: hypothetical protein VNR00_16675 [Opitutus sp.]|nr:hypothetical protein [Opitutus sp.]